MKALYNTIKVGALSTLFALTSCSYEDPIHSTVTVYPIITIEGGEVMLHEGDTYTDPGAVATIGDEEVPLDITFVGRYRNNTYNGTLDTSKADIYLQQYTATNDDGFSATETREVIVANTGDLVNSIEGLYTSTVFRNGVQGSPASAYTDIEYIIIWKNADGSYGISDTFGGWYLFGRAIPLSETPGGVIVANDISANDFSFPGTQTNRYFGGSAQLTGMTVDPDTKTIIYTAVWNVSGTTYNFETHLTQVQF